METILESIIKLEKQKSVVNKHRANINNVMIEKLWSKLNNKN